jgi:hypothetical protein
VNKLAVLLAVAGLAAAVVGQHSDTLLERATTRIAGQPVPGDPDQPAHSAGVGVGALPWITGW